MHSFRETSQPNSQKAGSNLKTMVYKMTEPDGARLLQSESHSHQYNGPTTNQSCIKIDSLYKKALLPCIFGLFTNGHLLSLSLSLTGEFKFWVKDRQAQ